MSTDREHGPAEGRLAVDEAPPAQGRKYHFKNTLTPLRFPRFFISKPNKGNERKGKEKESSQKQKTKTGQKKHTRRTTTRAP